MRVQLDMPAEDVRRIQAAAAVRRTTPGDIVRTMVLGKPTLTVEERIKAMVLQGSTDAEVSAATGETPARVAAVRKDWGLRPNRHRKPASGGSWADGFGEYARSFEVLEELPYREKALRAALRDG